MATSMTTQTTSSLAANGSSLPRKTQNNSNLPKPKLTGWAQAAARSLPKSQHQQQQSGQSSSSQQQRYIQFPANANRPNSNSISSNNNSSSPSVRRPRKQTNGSISAGNANNSVSNNSYKSKQPYNRDEVRSYMRDLFAQYASSTSISTYKDLNSSRKGNNLDWGTVTNSRYRNKKYGCLNDIAQALRNS